MSTRSPRAIKRSASRASTSAAFFAITWGPMRWMIVATSAIDAVVAVATTDDVVTAAAVDAVMAVTALDDVMAAAAGEAVVAFAPLDEIVAASAMDPVVAFATVGNVVTATETDVVVVGTSDHGIGSAPGVEAAAVCKCDVIRLQHAVDEMFGC